MLEIVTGSERRCFNGTSIDFSVLSGERVSQMTKTYSDVDAVQRLLEEVMFY
jgi:hypothetical protein